jgi:transcription factor IIIB 90 kDa subunit
MTLGCLRFNNLVDFSSLTFTGYTFIRLCQMLSLQLPIVDPALYIRRFAAELKLGTKADVVASTSLRIVSQMKRDWMTTGNLSDNSS